MAGARLVVALLVFFLLFGCPGSGCQNDVQCKPKESCVKGVCTPNCARQLEWCEAKTDCCPGMECHKNACRFPYDIIDNQTSVPPENATPFVNNTELTNQTLVNATNGTVNLTPSNFRPKVFDLAEGQAGSVGNLSISVMKISEELKGCSIENPVASLRAFGLEREKEFALKPGENTTFLNADVKVLDIPVTVLENETYCSFSDALVGLELGKKTSWEAILEKGQHFLLPDGESLIEATDISDLGELSENWREFNLSEGESLSVGYPYLGSLNYLDLKVEGIDEGTNVSSFGKSCNITSKWVRMKAKTAGTEIFTAASEGDNTTVQWHKIKVEKVSEELFPSDGKTCAQANKTVLLNISFPRANQNLLVKMKLYRGDNVATISASGSTPWESEDLSLEVSSPGGESSSGKVGTYLLRATALKRKNVLLSIGETAGLDGLSASLDSLEPKTVENGNKCVLVDLHSRLRISGGSQRVGKGIPVGGVLALDSGGWARFTGISYKMDRNISSCKVILKRAIIAVSPLNDNASEG